jgi:TaqI-like C-terminal specificity domain/Eco57I restriction-modification methylase
MSLPFDFELSLADIQALENREQVVGLFAALGYNTEARLTQTAEAMGLTGEALKHEVRHVERIAQQDDGALQVYLAELRSVTVANTQALARALRNRAGIFLWVLTSDYDRLDFVLFEAMAPETKATSGLNGQGVSLRPRVLTVNRRDPGPTRLRALRRFSYTEADADYQYDKLRSAYSIAEWAEPYFNNRALFSDYYLKQRLPRGPEWAEGGQVATALSVFQKQYDGARQRLHGKPEGATRTQLLEPALKALGFAAKAGGRKTADDFEKPDYDLMAGPGDGQTLAFCNAYVWDRYLDGRDEGRDTETPNENPGAVVVSLLERDDAPDWAIVTNGKTWRLYSKKAHSRASNYYEIDLEEALASPDPGDAFRYFWLLFRAEAFTRAPAAEGAPEGAEKALESFLDRLLAESALYAKALGERLKDRVFEEIFPEFAAGFIADIRANEGAQAELDEARLDEVFQGTLAFLYRLLFLLYAEARDLLPVRETREYFDASLTRLKQEVAEHAADIEDETPERLDKAYSASETGLYKRLGALFAVIDAGDADRNVPLYNGGLFLTKPAADDTTPEARNARFMRAQAIPDRFLARGLDRLARDIDEKTQALAFIDYKSLGVRQLGSIYEGLLEFKVRVAKEKLAVVKGKKTDEVVPYRQAEAAKQRIKATLRKGQVYLENDRRERKATGSYYTPDYIVKYIVKNTVGPVLGEKCDALRPKLREAQKAYREAIKRQAAFVKQGMPGDDPEKVANTFRAVVDELFGLRVLDPAMGSGHFLVEAVGFITDGLLNFLNAFPWNPVTAELRRTRETILEAMEIQKVSVDPAKLSDVNLLKRHVLKRCIYGVDLNPMAVELAKVSLWLDCFTLGAPLSFLDHHLKTGNSLIGARVAEVRAAVEFKQNEQMSLFASSPFTGIMMGTELMRHVGALEDVTAEQVKLSRSEYGKAMDALAPYKRVMDVYVSKWFGNEPSKAQAKFGLEPTIDFLRRPDVKTWLDAPQKANKKLSAELKMVGETALMATDEHRFFHWELEFPEVFFGAAAGTTQAVGLKENGGFDAIVANPPYIRSVRLKQSSPDAWRYYPIVYEAAANGEYDIYLCFTQRGFNLLQGSGHSGMVMPNKWFTTSVGTTLRELLGREQAIEHIVDFGFFQVFADVTTYSCLLFLGRAKSNKAHLSVLRSSDSIAAPLPDVSGAWDSSEVSTHELSAKPWALASGLADGILQRLSTLPTLGAKANIFKGTGTSADDVFILETHSGALYSRSLGQEVDIERSLLFPCITGRDVNPYDISTDKYLIFPYQQKPNEARILSPDSLAKSYPKTWAYLRQPQNRELLAKRDNDAFRARTDWYAYARPQNMHRLGDVKVVCPDIAGRAEFALDLQGRYMVDTVYAIVPIPGLGLSLHSLLAVLNSSIMTFFLKQTGTNLRGGYFRMKTAYLEPFPIALALIETRTADQVGTEYDIARLHKDWLRGGTLDSLQSDQLDGLLRDQPTGRYSALALEYLSSQMTSAHTSADQEIERFLNWLVIQLRPLLSEEDGVSLNVLTGRSKLLNYLGDHQKNEGALPFDELMGILHRNRTRLGVSLNDARFVARLKAEYEKSLAVLLPIKELLAFTDKLIDQIVYRLYGLTEEEVAVVEGKH